MCLSTRPHFPDAQGYLQHVRDCLSRRLRYWWPVSVDELAALKVALPSIFAEFKPSEHDLAMIVRQCRFWSMIRGDEHLAEVADILEHDPQPQSDAEFETLLLKLRDDPDARLALNTLLTGRAVA